MSEGRGKFFQFPINLLAEHDFNEVLSNAFAWGVVGFLDKSCDGWRSSRSTKVDYFKEAQKVIGFKDGSVDDCLSRHAATKLRFTSIHTKLCEVRLSTELYFDIRNRNALDETQARVLFALLSLIGARPYVKAGWPPMQWRAAGRLSASPKFGEVIGPVISRGKIERALKVVLDRKLLVGATYKHGERYWAKNTGPNATAELWEHIRRLKLGQARKRTATDEMMSAKIVAEVAQVRAGGHVNRDEHVDRPGHVPSTS